MAPTVRRRARSARALPRPPALANLLTVIGDTLKPKITAVIHPANKGADLQVRADLRVTRVKVVTMPGRGHTTTGSRSEGFVDIHLHPTIRWKDVSGEVCNGYERLLFKEFQVTFQCHQLAAHSLVPDGLCLHVVELLKIPPS